MNKEVYLASLDTSAAWHHSEPLICTSVVPEAPNIATFSFSAASGAWFRFKAGQFLQFALPVGEDIVNRVYIRKLSGEVHMVHNGGISEKEIEQRFVLACCSNPIGTVSIAI